MMRLLLLEGRKLRGKRVLLTAMLMMGMEMLFVSMNALSQRERLTHPGAEVTWGYLLSHYGMLNGLFFVAMLAVCASRLADMERDGGMRLSCLCGQRLAHMWDCKMIVLMTLAALSVLAQLTAVSCVGRIVGLPGAPNADMCLRFAAGTLMVSLPAAVISLFLALHYDNQLIALSEGMLAALIGFISILLPAPLRNLLLYGNFAELITATPQEVGPGQYEVADTAIHMTPLVLALLFGVALYALARRKIARREC